MSKRQLQGSLCRCVNLILPYPPCIIRNKSESESKEKEKFGEKKLNEKQEKRRQQLQGSLCRCVNLIPPHPPPVNPAVSL